MTIIRKKRDFLVVLELPSKEDSHWVASAPSLGCITQGRTRKQALDRIRKTIRFALDTLEKEGETKSSLIHIRPTEVVQVSV